MPGPSAWIRAWIPVPARRSGTQLLRPWAAWWHHAERGSRPPRRCGRPSPPAAPGPIARRTGPRPVRTVARVGHLGPERHRSAGVCCCRDQPQQGPIQRVVSAELRGPDRQHRDPGGRLGEQQPQVRPGEQPVELRSVRDPDPVGTAASQRAGQAGTWARRGQRWGPAVVKTPWARHPPPPCRQVLRTGGDCQPAAHTPWWSTPTA